MIDCHESASYCSLGGVIVNVVHCFIVMYEPGVVVVLEWK
jgi:hypothetical protein